MRLIYILIEMDQFGRLPTDVQNYIRDFYQSPIMQLKVVKDVDNNVDIELHITYPHFICTYRFNTAIEKIPPLACASTGELSTDDRDFYSISDEAYIDIKKFIHVLESNVPAIYNDNYDGYGATITITVDSVIVISYGDHTLTLGIEHKDALIRVFKQYIDILNYFKCI